MMLRRLKVFDTRCRSTAPRRENACNIEQSVPVLLAPNCVLCVPVAARRGASLERIERHSVCAGALAPDCKVLTFEKPFQFTSPTQKTPTTAMLSHSKAPLRSDHRSPLHRWIRVHEYTPRAGAKVELPHNAGLGFSVARGGGRGFE
jgi:hypothetical protein